MKEQRGTLTNSAEVEVLPLTALKMAITLWPITTYSQVVKAL